MVSLPEALVREVDAVRGPIPRSQWIQASLEGGLETIQKARSREG
jgi:metal-responsive CopG/Arc/MetJ family transcriptional regulator